VEIKEEPSNWANGEMTNEKKVAQGNAFKKKNFRNNNEAKKNDGVPKLLRGIRFTIARDGPDLYLKAMERRGVYVCATYKNGSDLEICLEAEELKLPEEPVLSDNPTLKKQRHTTAKHVVPIHSCTIIMWCQHEG